MRYLKRFPDFDNPVWRDARFALARSDTRIAHIDTGLFAHTSLGFNGSMAPRNILFALGKNLYDPGLPYGDMPQTTLRKGTDWVSREIDFPDHGIKTLSIILSESAQFTGAAPRAKVVPFRVSNGPLFRKTQRERQLGLDPTARIGTAINSAMDLNPRPRVITLSMGNPDLQPWELIRLGLGGSSGIDRTTAKAIDRAYVNGIPVICAAGQVVRSVVLPALMHRTIAVGGYSLRDDLQTPVHYPRGGYTNPSRVDTWALAANMNRAAGRRLPNGTILQTHAATENSGEPSGTSYATPFVTAAYALWFEKHRNTLLSNSFSGQNAWKRVEAFRDVLRNQMPSRDIATGHSSLARISIRPLDIPRLLVQVPNPNGLTRKQPWPI